MTTAAHRNPARRRAASWVGVQNFGTASAKPSGGSASSFGSEEGTSLPELRKRYLDRLGDTPEIRKALDVILEEARVNAAATELPQHVIDAHPLRELV